MLKVAMLSGWHVHAREYANQIKNTKNVELTAVWDENPQRGSKWAKELGVPFENDLIKCLERQDVDAVAVSSPTNMHKDIMVSAANAGKHIFTEKVMALNVKECKAIYEAVKETGVKFCISFPHRTLPQNLFVKMAVEQKLIGEVTLLRVRNAHNGAVANWLPAHFYDVVQCGGGAMMDLGAHPMYLSRWLLGKPKRLTAMFNSFTGKEVEDNAVATIEFENNAIAIVETGFVSTHSPFSLELYGTDGSVFVGGPQGQVQIRSNAIASDIQGWIRPDKLPAPLPSAIDQWVNGILHNEPIHFGIEEGTQLTELMQAAYMSHRERCEINFPLE